MSRGSTWGEEETRFLIEIWSEDIIISQLQKTHKNSDTFQVFSEKMRERGGMRGRGSTWGAVCKAANAENNSNIVSHLASGVCKAAHI